ncbi:flagellar hook-length control protein FliK [Salipiger sp. IMCC34102]|uniref:flagellar hook-length control protein FliK n=1 Tax=Salipiger sp. IMCC34102 TaxID=2510647 RepID=UPI0013EDD7A3|nr:flagellar hook-length control protein FliK [Salipiger sp. IMCC34102]
MQIAAVTSGAAPKQPGQNGSAGSGDTQAAFAEALAKVERTASDRSNSGKAHSDTEGAHGELSPDAGPEGMVPPGPGLDLSAGPTPSEPAKPDLDGGVPILRENEADGSASFEGTMDRQERASQGPMIASLPVAARELSSISQDPDRNAAAGPVERAIAAPLAMVRAARPDPSAIGAPVRDGNGEDLAPRRPDPLARLSSMVDVRTGGGGAVASDESTAPSHGLTGAEAKMSQPNIHAVQGSSPSVSAGPHLARPNVPAEPGHLPSGVSGEALGPIRSRDQPMNPDRPQENPTPRQVVVGKSEAGQTHFRRSARAEPAPMMRPDMAAVERDEPHGKRPAPRGHGKTELAAILSDPGRLNRPPDPGARGKTSEPVLAPGAVQRVQEAAPTLASATAAIPKTESAAGLAMDDRSAFEDQGLSERPRPDPAPRPAEPFRPDTQVSQAASVIAFRAAARPDGSAIRTSVGGTFDQLQVAESNRNGLRVEDSSIDPGIAAGPATLSSSSPVAAASNNPTGSQAAAVAQQLASAVVTRRDNQVEVSLNPAELGRVRMSIQAQDSMLTLVIQVDRPETADLMRRHAETLASEFRQMGYNNLTMDISTGGERATSDRGTSASAPPGAADEPSTDGIPTSPPPAFTGISGGLDLKV